jgi:hypothetical protein
VPVASAAVVPRLPLNRAFPLPGNPRRNLGANFEAVAAQQSPRLLPWDISPRDVATQHVAAEALISPRSVASDQSDDWLARAVLEIVGDEHDDMMQAVLTHFPLAVRAMKAVIGDIEQRTTEPSSGGAGFNTPLWKGKVEALDENFLERLLPLTLARALLNREGYDESIFKIFDCLRGAPNEISTGHALVSAVDQATDLFNSSSHDVATLAFSVEHGIETRRWWADRLPGEPSHRAIKDLGTAAIGLAAQIPAMVRNALVRAACQLDVG